MRWADFQELYTARLRLRKLRMDDLEDYYHRLGGSREVTRYMLFQPHKDIAESAASIEKNLRRYAAGRHYHWAIAARDTDSLMGVITLLRIDEETGTCSFAYMLGKDFWGRGYGTEALKAVLDFGFSQLELERIEADHMAENAASGAVMRKVGMTWQGMEPAKYEKNGRTYDAVCYGITREVWLNLEKL